MKRDFLRQINILCSLMWILYALGGKIQAGISAVQKDRVMAGT